MTGRGEREGLRRLAIEPVAISGGDAKPGDAIGGRYRLRRKIAQGGMGEVFEAFDEVGARRVAIKLLRADLGEDADWRARFKREVAIAVAIECPHVPRLLEAGKTQAGRRWIAFEYLEGESLDVRLERDGTVPFVDLAWMVEHALLGLEAAQAVGVVHRDIKPANLMIVTAGPKLCVLDFGVAKRLRPGSATSGLTSIDDRLGTPSYMSPEQLVSAADVDGRSDLYGLGLVVYRALVGRLPFGNALSVSAAPQVNLGRILPSLMSATERTWPDALQGWLEHAAAPRIVDRFDSATAALAAWRRVVTAMDGYVHRPVDRGYFHEDTDMAPLPEPSRRK